MTHHVEGVNEATAGMLAPVTVTVKWAVTAWMTGAACATRPDLPWVADDAPTGVIQRMAAICHGCPVMAACDAFVNTLAGTELDVGGGFWAGKYRNPAPDITATQRGGATQLPLPGLTLGHTVPEVAA
ncbi:MAG: WhiB family transcriptional regulator [Humibacillus sp.]|nr:WhiB family transcriptional regulator [Humibacillus sp.]MDN5779050.1 WhiB family transcriptional regulator [Humibacillus sp.]